MRTDQYALMVEKVLREIPNLERRLGMVDCKDEQKKIERTLKLHTKRFERMISFKFRMQLRNLCKQVGVDGDFLE